MGDGLVTLGALRRLNTITVNNLVVAGTLTVAGAITESGNLGVVGNFSVNTNKFNVTAASGNTTVAGTLGVTSDLAVNTNKFTVTASSGNTLVAGTLAVTGAQTFTGNSTFAGYILRSVGNALTAAGTTRADALQLANSINNVTTAASGTGVILPVGVVGMRIVLFNSGANALKVYASGSETIDGTAGSSGVTLTNAKRCEYFFTVANTWISAQLGVVSA